MHGKLLLYQGRCCLFLLILSNMSFSSVLTGSHYRLVTAAELCKSISKYCLTPNDLPILSTAGVADVALR